MRPDPERVRLAAEALARARADAWARGDRPGKKTSNSSAERIGASTSGQLPASWSARTRRDDPQPLNVAVGGMLSARGWRPRAAVASVFGRWDEIVGPQVAPHVRPVGFADGELIVEADSPAWGQQLRLLKPQILKRLSEELGAGTVRHVKVKGAGTRRPGRFGR